MSKITITYDGMSDIEALSYVSSVIKQGKISNENTQYCYITKFRTDKGHTVYADKTKTGTFTFNIF